MQYAHSTARGPTEQGRRRRGLAALGLTIAAGALALGAVGCGLAAGGDDADTPVPTATAQQPVDVAYLPNPTVPPPVQRTGPQLVEVDLEVREIDGRLADGAGYTYWTFGGTVPGTFIRVREGDTVELTLTNAPESTATHNIDLHAVTGPGGGAEATSVDPGETKTFRFQALNPGLYVYHCATPVVPVHIAQGMYGLILVEPAEGLPEVDHEFYVMQGEIYTEAKRGDKGMQVLGFDDMLAEDPDYVVFNGAVGSLTGERAMKVNVGDTVRIYFGVGGPNLTSSFHVIGEIFDTVYPEGALADAIHDVQTTLVPTGGSAVVEFTVEVPGNYILVDHSLSRLLKGAAGILTVEGPDNPQVFTEVE
jgi:nitrite reductase (NO-forming)